jgi:hypothetical protein
MIFIFNSPVTLHLDKKLVATGCARTTLPRWNNSKFFLGVVKIEKFCNPLQTMLLSIARLGYTELSQSLQQITLLSGQLTRFQASFASILGDCKRLSLRRGSVPGIPSRPMQTFAARSRDDFPHSRIAGNNRDRARWSKKVARALGLFAMKRHMACCGPFKSDLSPRSKIKCRLFMRRLCTVSTGGLW